MCHGKNAKGSSGALQLGTCCCICNGCCRCSTQRLRCGYEKIVDDETIYLSDQFFKKTLANLEENTKVSILFWAKDGAYQIHGTARYINEGDEFEANKAWADGMFEKLGLPIQAKGGVFVHVDAVYQVASGPEAGNQIA